MAAAAALLRGQRLTLKALVRALSMCSKSVAKHSIKRIDHLLGNALLHAKLEHYLCALARDSLSRQTVTSTESTLG